MGEVKESTAHFDISYILLFTKKKKNTKIKAIKRRIIFFRLLHNYTKAAYTLKAIKSYK